MAKVYIVGIGPGGQEHMTLKAIDTIRKCPVIVGYTFYIELIKDMLEGKKLISTGMKNEMERCRAALEEAEKGFDTCIISTGDSGLYGMAGPVLELAEGVEIEVVPGVTSAFSAASEVGAPIMHDFCTISLSDLLTPWDVIEKRLNAAAGADFVIALYNPRSRTRKDHFEKAINIIAKYQGPDTPAALVRNAGRSGNERRLMTLGTIDTGFVDMMTIVIIGNSTTYVKNDRMITPRGYAL